MEYTFTLTFRFDASTSEVDTLLESLGEAGCDDAVVGIGKTGAVTLAFERGALNAEEALATAMQHVKSAIPGAQLVEAAPDYVGLSDIAAIMGVTRQAVRKLMLAHANAFPMPVHAGQTSIWHLALVLDFFRERRYAVSQALYEIALANLEANVRKEATLLGSLAKAT